MGSKHLWASGAPRVCALTFRTITSHFSFWMARQAVDKNNISPRPDYCQLNQRYTSCCMDPPYNGNEQLGPYLQYISRHEQTRHDCPMCRGQYRWKGKKNRLRITRGAGELVLAAPHSPWLMMVAMWLQSSVVTCPDIMRVANLLDMALWSTGSYRRADGEEGRHCPRSQCHMLRIWGDRLLTAAWSPCIHYSLQHSVLHCRQGWNFNAENTEGVAFRGYQAGWGRRVLLRQSEAVELFIAALYEQPSSSSMAQAHYNKIMYTRKQIRINMSLPPTDLIIYPHLKRVHFQMLRCKAAHQLGSLGVSISQNMAGRSKME